MTSFYDCLNIVDRVALLKTKTCKMHALLSTCPFTFVNMYTYSKAQQYVTPLFLSVDAVIQYIGYALCSLVAKPVEVLNFYLNLVNSSRLQQNSARTPHCLLHAAELFGSAALCHVTGKVEAGEKPKGGKQIVES